MSSSSMRELPDPPRGPLTWDDVRCMKKVGMYDLAEIAAGYVRRREKRQRRRKRLLRLLSFGWYGRKG